MTAPVIALSETGVVDVMAGIYIDERQPGCAGIHTKKDFIYFTPSTNASNADAPWRLIAEDEDAQSRYKVLTGDFVNVTFRATANTSTNSTRRLGRRLMSDEPPLLDFELDSIDILNPSAAKEIYTNETIRVRSTIYIIETCGWKASATVAQLRKLFWKNESSGAPNIEDYHSMCSYGKVVANGSETYIMGPVEVPCWGNVSSGVIRYAYNGSRACGAAEQFAWRTAGENMARSLGLGAWMNATTRRRIVTVLPREVTCGWAGLGSVGCGGRFCTTYIKGGYGLTLTIQMHELGHTQGLSHAGRGLDEYGDRGDVLGSTGGADGYLCVNPGNQLRIGWNSPIGYLRAVTVNDAPTNTGQRGIWRLPNMAFTDVNHVYINMSALGLPYANHFASFRARTPTYDAILSNDYNNRVHIHQFNGTTNDRDYNRTLLMALLGPGQWYMSRFVDYGVGAAGGGALNFSVINITAGSHAFVRICRASAPPATAALTTAAFAQAPTTAAALATPSLATPFPAKAAPTPASSALASPVPATIAPAKPTPTSLSSAPSPPSAA
ncbi:hypothetical protein HYH03_006019 [Edaphochlamys debaryana]|uniref:Peptidase M11 gametolysin domain-containing protein n=1 Tax=Edaphochlamys debaryana TaxID=47281 RepID=A0A836C1Q4_9CHLO|nr:hypothetical protein HYH03_006019 [Edaphochlamys debaryana]|eukprot:KAG2495774.1 hypothetical protein HYH03_006019 [Edaphochlamys debaryana]